MFLYPSSSHQRLHRQYRSLVGLLCISIVALTGCGSGNSKESTAASTAASLSAEVVAGIPSDSSSFIQGLEVMPEGDLLVSTGLEGRSRIYRTALGAASASDATVSVDLESDFFGEGSTRHDATIWQLTWKNGVAISRDATTLVETGRVDYDGEGWGLCSNGERLVMSDGTSTLTFRDPQDFHATGQVEVTLDGKPIDQINELDCSDGVVWANLWHSDRIVRINPATGKVTGILDTAELDMPARERTGADVLNGIARVPGTADRFLLTGKLWDTIYEVAIHEQ